MKKIYTVSGYYDINEKENKDHFHDDYVFTGEDDHMQVSDGYHTMDDLYSHRNMLFLMLAQKITELEQNTVWKSRKNSDGSEWDGWFVLGIGIEPGKQITYHLPEKFWEVCHFAHEVDRGFWDGHTSNDVLLRLLKL